MASAATMTQLHPPVIENDTIVVVDEQSLEGDRQALTGEGYVVSGDAQIAPAGLQKAAVNVSALQVSKAANLTAKQPAVFDIAAAGEPKLSMMTGAAHAAAPTAAAR